MQYIMGYKVWKKEAGIRHRGGIYIIWQEEAGWQVEGTTSFGTATTAGRKRWYVVGHMCTPTAN